MYSDLRNRAFSPGQISHIAGPLVALPGGTGGLGDLSGLLVPSLSSDLYLDNQMKTAETLV